MVSAVSEVDGHPSDILSGGQILNPDKMSRFLPAEKVSHGATPAAADFTFTGMMVIA
jgi:hypothetical protein